MEKLRDLEEMCAVEVVAASSTSDQDTIVVDQAGLHFIHNGPSSAAGASEEVKATITEECEAKYFAYADGRKKCIHVVWPNLHNASMDTAVDKLAMAYCNVLKEFCDVGMETGLKKLRLLPMPISGGIFSGPIKEDLPMITARSVKAAYQFLSERHKQHIGNSSIEMCVFQESEFEAFASAFGTQVSPNFNQIEDGANHEAVEVLHEASKGQAQRAKTAFIRFNEAEAELARRNLFEEALFKKKVEAKRKAYEEDDEEEEEEEEWQRFDPDPVLEDLNDMD